MTSKLFKAIHLKAANTMNNGEIKSIIEKLEASPDFTEWKKDHPEFYLTHAIIILGDPEEYWQIGYYSKDLDKIVSFTIKDEIEIAPESDVFKQDKGIEELKMDSVDVEFKDAVEKAKDFQKNKYPAMSPLKQIVLLQHLNVGQIWNITYVTASFNTLNIKIHAKKGKILEDKIITLVQK